MRNKPVTLICGGALLIGLITLSCLAAIGKFNYVHPEGVVMDVTNDGVIKLRNWQPPAAVPLAETAPKAIPDDTEHDFGIMNPLTMGRHTFLIRNEGDAPLLLEKGSTSCKCTLSKLGGKAIAPGELGRVTLEWNTGRDPVYSHHAEIHTNDPKNSTIRLVVRGNVRMRVGVDPPEVAFKPIVPGKAGTTQAILYSQVWDDLEFSEVQSSRDGMTCTIEPAEKEVLLQYEAKSAYRVTLKMPAGLPRGSFREWIRFDVTPSGDEATSEAYELPVTGEVLGRLAVLGPAVDGQGIVNLGVLPSGRGTKKRLVLRIRDQDQELRVKSIETVPSFIETRIVPYEPAKEGLSYIELQVPSNAPTCSYRGQPYGQVQVRFDHPRIDSLDLKGQARRRELGEWPGRVRRRDGERVKG